MLPKFELGKNMFASALGYTNVGAGRLQLVEDDDELLNDIRGYVKNHGDDSISVKRSRSS